MRKHRRQYVFSNLTMLTFSFSLSPIFNPLLFWALAIQEQNSIDKQLGLIFILLTAQCLDYSFIEIIYML